MLRIWNWNQDKIRIFGSSPRDIYCNGRIRHTVWTCQRNAEKGFEDGLKSEDDLKKEAEEMMDEIKKKPPGGNL